LNILLIIISCNIIDFKKTNELKRIQYRGIPYLNGSFLCAASASTNEANNNESEDYAYNKYDGKRGVNQRTC
jgi:hypothetical protein